MTFEELRHNKPTSTWLENDEENEFFTAENIAALNHVLDTYLSNLEQLGDNPTESQVIETIKEVVLQINDLNEQYDYYIETLEREDLYVFITTGAQLAGVESDDDLTEEWREW